MIKPYLGRTFLALLVGFLLFEGVGQDIYWLDNLLWSTFGFGLTKVGPVAGIVMLLVVFPILLVKTLKAYEPVIYGFTKKVRVMAVITVMTLIVGLIIRGPIGDVMVSLLVLPLFVITMVMMGAEKDRQKAGRR